MSQKTTVWSLLFLAIIAMSGIGLADALSAAPIKNNWLVVDFDGTCTVRDTITMLPRLASLAQSRLPPIKSDKVTLSPDAVIDFQGRLSIFSMLEDEYFRKYTEAMESMKPGDANESDETTMLEELAKSIDKLDDVSTAITHEVSNWRVLGGLGDLSKTEMLQLIDVYKEKQMALEPKTIKDRETNYDELLGCLSLKEDCLSVLRNCAESQDYGIGVLSINWCPLLIESLLVHPLCESSESEALSDDIAIWSNSVNAEGIVALPFPGAIAKREKILEIQNSGREDDSFRVVYVGDSSTDLLAIIQADVGILLGGSQSATTLAKQYGVTVKPLSEFDDENSQRIVWTANNWQEIGSFLDER